MGKADQGKGGDTTRTAKKNKQEACTGPLSVCLEMRIKRRFREGKIKKHAGVTPQRELGEVILRKSCQKKTGREVMEAEGRTKKN